MGKQKLMEIEKIEEVEKLFGLAKQSYKCFNFQEALDFFNKGRIILESISNNKLRSLLLKSIGLSYFRLKDWENAKKSLESALQINIEFESKLYLFLSLYQLEETPHISQLLQEIYIEFGKVEDFYFHFKNWILDMIDSWGMDRVQEFISFLETEDYDDKWNMIYNMGWVLADYGFSDFAIELFKKEIPSVEDSSLKAKYYNNIGTVYYDRDEYDLALKNFHEAISIDKNFYLGFRNIGQTHFGMIDLGNAVKFMQRALNIAQRQGVDTTTVEQFKRELRLIQRLQGNIFLIDRITDEDVSIFLRSAEKMTFDYLRGTPPPDISVILIEYSKVLETMLHRQVSIHFSSLIEKYRKIKWSKDFRDKFGMLMNNRSISPGNWAKIIEDFSLVTKEADTKEFRKVLLDHFNPDTLKVIKNACDFMALERNPVSHTEMRDMNYVLHRRVKIIGLLNKVIEKIY
jgi:tetratricopeptide (TPR) repeat protein